ncbi:MAG TPA: tRNA uridine-5-carboxymethylaminomethyl(34) synthesis GTPase MnmE [Bacteroidales bacterium]|nr:tRNA uridine-5-carboxymethylaminomethyl(34) synthesis GTPase MnmE [Bacteroidales bacterium]
MNTETPISSLASTICAPATPHAVGALALIRMSGPQALEIAWKVFHSAACPDLTQSEGYRTYFGRVTDSAGELLDQVLLSVFRAPHSFTGEDSVEISCHGSLYIQDTLLRTLVDNGAVMAGPGEFSQRAFMNGKMDLTQAEAVADLIASENRTSHKLAMDQMRGVFSQELSVLRSRLLELAALMELELDFAEEDVEFADKRELHSLVNSLLLRIGNLCDSFRMGNVMKKGVPVAIAGVVNAGKSTLLNALLGEEKALVTPVAGTTRDTIEDVIVLDGIPFRFIDTAGLRHIGDVDELSQEHIEKLGVKRSLETIRSASVLMLVLDASRPETYMESLQSALVHDMSGKVHPQTQLGEPSSTQPEGQQSGKIFNKEHIVFVINKIDLVDNKDVALEDFMNTLRNYAVTNGLSSFVDKGFGDSGAYNPVDDAKCADHAAFRSEGFSVLPISAATNSGIEDVKNALVGMIRPVLDRNTVMLTNVRHYQELRSAREALERLREGLEAGLSGDLLTPDLRQALHHVGSIVGEITPDDILGEIFGRFCIGK